MEQGWNSHNGDDFNDEQVKFREDKRRRVVKKGGAKIGENLKRLELIRCQFDVR